jgi:hypothetical protein
LSGDIKPQLLQQSRSCGEERRDPVRLFGVGVRRDLQAVLDETAVAIVRGSRLAHSQCCYAERENNHQNLPFLVSDHSLASQDEV